MKPFSIILFSDIHFGVRPYENQAPVFNAFIEDVKKNTDTRLASDLYLFCLGDLVQAAEDNSHYMGFKEHILNPIIKNCGLSNSNILLLPGNHDAQRNVIESIKDSHFKDLKDNNSEGDFNNYISEHYDSFANIFSNFRQTTIEYPNSQWKNLGFLGFDIDNDWCVACLNTALCTFAHINNLHDEGNLAIATRPLYEWLDTKVGRRKILLMHHPIDVLSFWAAEELKGLIRTKFDIVITGHTHNQDLTKPLSSVREIIFLIYFTINLNVQWVIAFSILMLNLSWIKFNTVSGTLEN